MHAAPTITPDETAYLDACRRTDWAEVDRLEQAINDREARLCAPDALATGARFYAEHGIPVFPLQPGAKVPFPRSRGFRDATTDPDQVATWWARCPAANIGLPTGGRFDVVDLDGPDGHASIAPYLEQLHVLAVARTARLHGAHLYVPASGRGNKAGVFPGVDYRGRGGYVVAPPSRLTSGARYDWTIPLDLTASQAAA